LSKENLAENLSHLLKSKFHLVEDKMADDHLDHSYDWF